jgi:hypothetical protein
MEQISTHVTANIFKYIGLEGHVHVHSPNDQTKLPLDHVQHSWDKFRGSFSRSHQQIRGCTVGSPHKHDVPGMSLHFFAASFSTHGLRSRNLTKYMLAYWCLNDLLMDWMVNEGVGSIRGKTTVGSRVIVVGGMTLANS